ncbi:MAG: zinc-ribbon domain-containing protein [Candidatus Acidiferrales bacterium]|jgi:uncharacterized membrane protein
MAFCGKCGAQNQDGVAFCARCGQPLAAGQPAPQQYQQAPPPQHQGQGAPSGGTGLEENVAGALCYVLGWVTGIIFLIIDKRPSVRFNAAQSIVVFGALQILSILIGIVTGGSMFFGGFGGWGWGPEFGFRAMLAMLGGLVNLLIGLLGFILWILLILKAYQRQPFRVPIAAGIADSLAGKSA